MPGGSQGTSSKNQGSDKGLQKGGSKGKTPRTKTSSSQIRVPSSQVEEGDAEGGAGYEDSQGVTVLPEGRKVKKAKTRKI